MKQDRLEEGKLTQNSRGLGTVTRSMVEGRARELALINGRDHPLQDDFDQAQRELTEEIPLAPEQSGVDGLPQPATYDPNPGSTGKKADTVPAWDEQTEQERLVEEGIQEAEHDQMVQATKARDQRRE